MTDPVLVEIDGRGVARLTMNRPEKHNALSAGLIDALREAATRLAADDTVRVVVLAGAGKSFCAGGDLRWMEAQMTSGGAARATEARRLADMLAALNELPKPVIGRIHANAFGGGVGLSCICDVSVGAGVARFGLTETKLGLIPATIGPYVIARMGEARARQVFMSSRVFGADEAVRLGILSRAVPAAELDAAVEAEVAPYLACAPGAVAEAKALALHLGGAAGAAARDHSIGALVARWETEEAHEGVAAFFAKRTPGWIR